MAIRFHCDNCNQIVSTPDGSGGKKGKCPHCSSIMSIPVVSFLSPENTEEAPPSGGLFSALPEKEALEKPASPIDELGLMPEMPATASKPADKIDFFPGLTVGNAGAQAAPTQRAPTQPTPAQPTPAQHSPARTPTNASSGSAPLNQPQDDLLSELTRGDSFGLQALESSGKLLEAPSSNPFGGGAATPFPGTSPTPSSNPYASPQTPNAGLYQRYAGTLPAHRGSTILILGLVGLFACQPLGIAAWLMGRSDLDDMNSNRMDPSGRGMTRTGMIFGMISTFLLALNIIVIIGIVALYL